MKKILFVLIIITMLISCVTFPEPESDSNSLVIGAFTIDLPDGYQAKWEPPFPPRMFTGGVKLHFRNISQNHDFIVVTDEEGHYKFLSNGSDEYLLSGFSFSRKIADWRYDAEGELNIKVENAPASIVYLGHSSFIFSKPRSGRRGFQLSLEVDWDSPSLLEYIEYKCSQNSCVWLDYKIIESRFEVADEYTGDFAVKRIRGTMDFPSF